MPLLFTWKLVAALFIRRFRVWRITFENAAYKAPFAEKLESDLDVIAAPAITISIKNIP